MGVKQAEFARLMGVHPSYVTRLKQSGRLVLDEDGTVNVEASRLRILETSDPNRDDVAARHAAARGGMGGGAADAPVPGSYQAARARKEKYLALQAQLDYERAAGKLIDRVAVERAVAGAVTLFRQRLENLPHRTAPLLISKTLDEIRGVLRDEVRSAFAELERELEARLNEIGETQVEHGRE